MSILAEAGNWIQRQIDAHYAIWGKPTPSDERALETELRTTMARAGATPEEIEWAVQEQARVLNSAPSRATIVTSATEDAVARVNAGFRTIADRAGEIGRNLTIGTGAVIGIAVVLVALYLFVGRRR